MTGPNCGLAQLIRKPFMLNSIELHINKIAADANSLKNAAAERQKLLEQKRL
jgi:hypothetical protein